MSVTALDEKDKNLTVSSKNIIIIQNNNVASERKITTFKTPSPSCEQM